MDLRLLRAFLAVADHRHYGAAAHQLSLTQPALTKQIQTLERQLGGHLFTRGRHGAALTDLGQSLLTDARDLVVRSDLLASRAVRFAQGTVGRLSVGFGLSSIELAPWSVAEFRRRWPDVSVTLDDMSSRAQIERIAAADLDVGFVRLPAGAGLQQYTLRQDRLAVAAPSAPAGELGAWLREHDLVRLHRDKGPGLAGHIDRFCAAQAATPGTVQVAHDLQTVLALVAAGVGPALVPASATRIAPSTVSVTPIDDPGASWDVGVVWNPEHCPPVVSNFLNVVVPGSVRAGQPSAVGNVRS
ncbi:LysR family transcriptional regulator [Phytoactinopolyspora limicola]|uniref:LysR family transcriptional regulator n=1 Tax=Phytoactinopolyspora limicola TaxID=2715536 RepID=UPI00140BC659|nr:LysR family transcriptional regulator [Phytoactinopolyspora limicola]